MSFCWCQCYIYVSVENTILTARVGGVEKKLEIFTPVICKTKYIIYIYTGIYIFLLIVIINVLLRGLNDHCSKFSHPRRTCFHQWLNNFHHITRDLLIIIIIIIIIIIFLRTKSTSQHGYVYKLIYQYITIYNIYYCAYLHSSNNGDFSTF